MAFERHRSILPWREGLTAHHLFGCVARLLTHDFIDAPGRLSAVHPGPEYAQGQGYDELLGAYDRKQRPCFDKWGGVEDLEVEIQSWLQSTKCNRPLTRASRRSTGLCPVPEEPGGQRWGLGSGIP